MIGFSFRETMTGSYTPNGATTERPMSFTVTARAASWLKHLRDRQAALEGHVTVEGLANHSPLRGQIIIDPVLGRLIRYTFDFVGDDGKKYRFEGQKDVSPLHPVESMTTLPGVILDAARNSVGQALVKFEKKRLPSFIGSFRLRF